MIRSKHAGTGLRCLDPSGLAQSQFSDRLLLEHVLADLAGDGSRQVLDDHDVLGNFEVSDLIAAVAFGLVGRQELPVLVTTQAATTSPYLASGTPATATSAIDVMAMQELFDLGGIDVFTAADDHFLAAADDPVVSILSHAGQVAGVQPAGGVDRRAVASRLL